jgi:DNA repair protein RadA/Sms
MAKPKTQYVCAQCGQSSPRWLGRCPACNAWGSLSEERAPSATQAARKAAPAGPSKATALGALSEESGDAEQRMPCGIAEFDRVLGGGPVAGGVTLVGGEPGIGKSTLMLQVLAGLAAAGRRTLYATGEESAVQVAMRARRIGGSVADVRVLATTDVAEVVDAIAADAPEAVVLDSIQTMRSLELESSAFSVGQMREVTTRLIDVAKAKGLSLFLIGHVTKEGAIAGPKVLEHLVDTVLAFEGDASHAYRLVRASKNRFGPSHELGVFEMHEDGLREVRDPSRLFLAERSLSASGSAVVPTAEGQRPLLVEVQALVAPAAYGAARRVALGVDSGRLAMLLAVLDRKAGIQVLDQDVFVSAVGGARIDEPAADLAIAVAVTSSLRDLPVPHDVVVFGEVGLTGELRSVPRAAQRLSEAEKLGFKRAVMPRTTAERLAEADRCGLEAQGALSLDDALQLVFRRR